MQPRVLVVDDDIDLAETLAEGLGERGFEALACSSSVEAGKRLDAEPFDALVTDLRMPEVDGMTLLARSRATAPERPVLVMTAYAAVETAIDAIRRGAYHYLTKPFTLDELALFVGRALENGRLRDEARSLRAALRDQASLGGLVAASAAMREVFELVVRVADAASPVLFLGETGTGKTAVARALHLTSRRGSGPFVAVNCAALPESLLESELFGHVKGAFTGATTTSKGLFAEAEGGTLLLDEIGEMPFALQAKLLHVLESGKVRPVGATREREVDVRVLAATHRDLRERARAGLFREDLLYRLDVVTIEIPALRHRRDDIPALLERLLASAREKHPRSPVQRFSGEATARLLEHAWPGNVRELAHAIERTVVLGRGPEVSLADLPPTLSSTPPAPLPEALAGGVLPIREVQRRYAAWALERCDGHKSRTAEALGVDVKTLAKWLSSED
jgi:two-component system response regulator HydG